MIEGVTPPAADIALLTMKRFDLPAAPEGDWYLANILLEDRLLTEALAAKGLTAARVDWANPDVDWSRFRAAIFRTTWDYFHRFDEFMAWFSRVENVTRLINRPSIIRWNIDKHYLADLEAKGIPIVPCRFIEPGSGGTLGEWLDASGWPEAIVKPCVSGGARHTYRVNRASAAAIDEIVHPLLATESLILQPFMDDILERGEDTLMVLNGRYTHAVRKTAKAGDFRVQDDFGGKVSPLEPTAEQVALAERAMAACDPAPAFGRVDMVRDNDGRLAIMELELLEPELWLRTHPPAAHPLAAAIAREARD
jgi:glutathione synthase/RimK-type ligase-like ATP-grasp enzyme